MHGVSLLRLYLLRVMYLLIAFAMGMQIWPLIVAPPSQPAHMTGVARALLGALSLVAVLGIRYPLRMLPLLLFELAWKVIWVAAIGLPLWASGRIDPDHAGTLFDCMLGVVLVPLVLPWGYVIDQYLRATGDPWTAARREPGL
jgi:hypothetical protein